MDMVIDQETGTDCDVLWHAHVINDCSVLGESVVFVGAFHGVEIYYRRYFSI